VDAPARHGAEVGGVGDGQSPVAGGLHDRGGERVLAGPLGGRGQCEHGVLVEGIVERGHGLEVRAALGERAGLVERDDGGPAECLHRDRGLDQHPAPPPVPDRGE
jgi:hypothetical protein